MTVDAHAAVPPGPVNPDVDKLFELINVWDHRCQTPGACPHPRGAVTRFARRIGRHRQTLWNLRAGKPVSATLITQLADVLHVDPAEITLAGALAVDQKAVAA